ncbi:diacylglycerol kinase family lipid kinase, partial [Bacillus spizizenii]|nr:diacylglycerol kinase family lipid kinase [Bacillus spizizenii]
MSHRKALLIHNGNAGNKHIEKALGAVVPVLS